jgi:hypothetical protein
MLAAIQDAKRLPLTEPNFLLAFIDQTKEVKRCIATEGARSTPMDNSTIIAYTSR